MRNFIVPDYTGDCRSLLFERGSFCTFPSICVLSGLNGFTSISVPPLQDPTPLSSPLSSSPFSLPGTVTSARLTHNLYTLRQGNVTVVLLRYTAKQGSSPCRYKSSHHSAPWSVIPLIWLFTVSFSMQLMKDPAWKQISPHSVCFHRLTPYKGFNSHWVLWVSLSPLLSTRCRKSKAQAQFVSI